MKEYDGKNANAGSYTGTFIDTSGKYGDVITLSGNNVTRNDSIHIHANVYTNEEAFNAAYNAANKSPGPFWNEVSAGCQVMWDRDFDKLMSALKGLGFKFNNSDTIPVTITDTPNPHAGTKQNAPEPPRLTPDEYKKQKYGQTEQGAKTK